MQDQYVKEMKEEETNEDKFKQRQKTNRFGIS